MKKSIITVSREYGSGGREIGRLLAARGSCVIVGRCADYVLRDMPGCTHLFFHAPLEDRIRRIVQRTGCTAPQAEERILATDKSRAAYHDHYARGRWGHASGYHFTVDCSIGIEPTADIIMQVLTIIEKSAL